MLEKEALVFAFEEEVFSFYLKRVFKKGSKMTLVCSSGMQGKE